ncbi:DUF3136 domain-containing protein [Spirosoma sp. HMF3257]|uniref:Uncharacterized protein n=1 Tax=Spirosoma telluris TaxID=2183553 RepID=A0A327NSR7_9BACT|nr:DUF3136 domain-containing protein [Spirosoma telluris]RAI78347.1 hypothetical protein HMF3257_04940 [Spirosoma telluris]
MNAGGRIEPSTVFICWQRVTALSNSLPAIYRATSRVINRV